ncbi:MAG: hypothetical protein LBG95_07100 [Treponema sp.]|jgi:hypothetical protein|nr:hypothetical protein [Treponema sp.]
MEFTIKINEKLSRYRAFFQNPQAGQILITIPPYTFSVLPRAEEGARPADPLKDAERMAEYDVGCQRHFNDYTQDVNCDFIPAISPGYGIGLNSAFFSDAPIIPGDGTTWVHPVLDALDDIDKLRFDPMNQWMCFMRRYMQKAVELCDGGYCVGMLSAFAPSDLANALRGNELFYDLYDEPEQVDHLLSVCTEATLSLYRELKPHTLEPEGGFCAGGLWLPGNGLFLSEDAADLCSSEIYRRYFFPQTQRLINEAGGAYIHHHAKGWQIHADISKLENLRFLEFSWDPNCPRPVDRLDELLELSLATPLQIRCTLPDLKKYIGQMRQGRIAVMVNVDTIDEAQDAVRIVRKHSII